MQNVGFEELQRGKSKSKARHQDIAKFYNDINNTKEKFLDALNENQTIIKQLNERHKEELLDAAVEINARNEIINQLAKAYNIEDEVRKAYPRAREIAKDKIEKTDNNKNNSNEELSL